MVDAKVLPSSVTEQSERSGNLAHRVSWRSRMMRLCLAFVLGVASSAVFAPLEWGWASWIALVPLLLMVERYERGHWAIGYFWGFGHFLFCLSWLKEVILPAPLGVGLICAIYPATFAWATGALMARVRWPASDDLEPKNGRKTLLPPLPCPRRQVILVIVIASLWCSVEWVRSWLFTGFPWNQLGVTQWSNESLLPVVGFAGVYGLSFLIALVNVGVFLAIVPWLRKERSKWQVVPVGLVMSLTVVVAVLIAIPKLRVPQSKNTLTVACVQGDIPQIRVPTPEQEVMAERVYRELTQWAASGTVTPELIVWPETALPQPQFKPNLGRDGSPSIYLSDIMERTQVPMLIGSLDYRVDGDFVQSFNSAILVNVQCERVQTYDKMKAVPFGEFLPFVDFYPGWFEKLLRSNHLFMRSLSTGKESTVFVVKDARIGVNICYEDVFPEVSRNLVLNGANLLFTITNDAWYNKTSGSHQHMVHAVFRAVETGRPLLRSGNNSDTCLILPDGSVTEALVGPDGDRFYRGYKIYHLPIYDNLTDTFYVRHGNLFVWALVGISVIALLYVAYRFLAARQRIVSKLTSD